MSAKSPAKSPAKKKVAVKKDHPKYKDMIAAAIKELANKKGSSKVAISKYILANYKVGDQRHDTNLKAALLRELKAGTIVKKSGIGCAGSFKFPVAAKPALKKRAGAAPKKKAVPKKKSATPKKKAAPKKKPAAAPKKKVAPKKKKATPAKKKPAAKKATAKKAKK